MPLIINGISRPTGEEQKDLVATTNYRPRRTVLSPSERKTLRILGTAEDRPIEELEVIQDGEICY